MGLSTLTHLSLKPLFQHPYTGGPWEPQHWGVRGSQRGQHSEVRGGRLAHQAGRWGRLAEASTYGDPTLREAAPTTPSHPWTAPPPHPAALCGVPAPQAWGPVGAGETLEGRVLRETLLDFQASETLLFPAPSPSQCGKVPSSAPQVCEGRLCSQVVIESPFFSAEGVKKAERFGLLPLCCGRGNASGGGVGTPDCCES